MKRLLTMAIMLCLSLSRSWLTCAFRTSRISWKQSTKGHASSSSLVTRMSSSSKNQELNSASLSRAPFTMPKDSQDDNKGNQGKSWVQLGLTRSISDFLINDLQFKEPTLVQQQVIPALLNLKPVPTQDKGGLAFLAATGSGKTLAYLLPIMQTLKLAEEFDPEKFKNARPKCLVLAPTRELAVQITSVVKHISHVLKLSSQALVGGEDYGKQRKRLSRPLDVVVATPGRLVKHWNAQHLYLGKVQFVVLDEMDTLLEQGFQQDLHRILNPLLFQKDEYRDNAPHVVLTSATMTQQVQKLVDPDNWKEHKVNAKRHFVKTTSPQELQQQQQQKSLKLPKLRTITAPGLHRAVPRLHQVFCQVQNVDKLSLLLDVVAVGGGSGAGTKVSESQDMLTLVFCNTVASCRAAQHALAEGGFSSDCYHGELNSAARAANLQKFRSNEIKILVCTDLAARGLDVPEVDHVVMFDFPLNSLDYLHRAGRTARGGDSGKHGRVTALVAKRDAVLAKAIETAVLKGDPLDGLSSRKSDYNKQQQPQNNQKRGRMSFKGRRGTSSKNIVKGGRR